MTIPLGTCNTYHQQRAKRCFASDSVSCRGEQGYNGQSEKFPGVDFIVAGSQKCATTALAQFLAAHPAICMSDPKEAHLFDTDAYSPHLSSDACNTHYAPFFEHFSGEKLCGEATPAYVFFPQVAAAMFRYNPALKLIVLLRDPADRAISHHAMEYGRGAEHLPLWLALLLEPLRLLRMGVKKREENTERLRVCSYASRGFYTQQLKNLLNCFSASQLLVLDSGRLKQCHVETMQGVFQFLEIDPSHPTEPEKVFTGSYGKHRLVRFFLRLFYWRERRKLARWLRKHGYAVEHFGWL